MGVTESIIGFFSNSQLFKLLEAGNNITITKTSDCKVRIDASGSGGPSTGTKYHLSSTDIITVLDRFEYLICGNFILDAGAQMIIDEGGRLAIIEGPILNDGTITNNGVIKLGA